jgi:serine/threonine protein kinase/Tfp pilus assembly protein PilF
MSDAAHPADQERLGELFERALALPPDARAAFLDEACGAEHELKSELLALLAVHARAPDCLERMAEGILPVVLDVLSNVGSLPGRVIAHYEILDVIGGGGMGVVYKARDLALGRLVALKFLRPHLTADPEARARLECEARAASALDHPNIAVVHEIGAAEPNPGDPGGDRLFIAMAYYPGETIREKIARGPLRVGDALSYAMQVADGLARAHEAGIVHRDIKPANVVVTDRGEAKIVDFGVARSADAEQTREGATPGTVAYMSPEQTRGEAVDHRTDLWSVGAMLYEMLTARRPFPGKDDAGVIQAICHDAPQPLLAMRPEVPAPLAAIVSTCLEKDPDQRYQTTVELLAALQCAQSADAHSPAARRWLHNRVPVYGVAALGLGAALLLVFLSTSDRPNAGPPTGAGLPAFIASPGLGDAPERSSRDTDPDPAAYQLYLRAQVYPLGTEEGNRYAYELLKRSVELDSTYAPAVAALGYRAYMLGFTGDRNQALEKAELAFEKALSLDPDQLQALTYRAMLFVETRRLREALEPLRHALSVHPNAADPVVSLAHVYRYAGLLEESARLFERARALDPTNRRVLTGGLAYLYLGRYEEALDLFALDTNAPGPLIWQGLAWLGLGQGEQARERFRAAASQASAGPFRLVAEALLAYLDGDLERSVETVRLLEPRAAEGGAGGEELYHYARLYALFGERSAVRMLERAIDHGFFPYPFLLADPFLDPVRDDPAVQRVLAKARARHEAFRALISAERHPLLAPVPPDRAGLDGGPTHSKKSIPMEITSAS